MGTTVIITDVAHNSEFGSKGPVAGRTMILTVAVVYIGIKILYLRRFAF